MRRHRIDGQALGAAIFMIDAIAPIMALDQTRAYQLGYSPADGGHSGFPYAIANRRIDNAIRFHGISWQFARGGQCRPHLLRRRTTLRMPRSAGRNCPGEPLPDRHQPFTIADERPRLAIGPRNARNKVEDHEGVTRSCGKDGNCPDDCRHVGGRIGAHYGFPGLHRFEKGQLHHGTNQAQIALDVNPLNTTVKGDKYLTFMSLYRLQVK